MPHNGSYRSINAHQLQGKQYAEQQRKILISTFAHNFMRSKGDSRTMTAVIKKIYKKPAQQASFVVLLHL